MDDIDPDRPLPAVSLLFRKGDRPSMRTIAQAVREGAGFAVAPQPQAEGIALPHWVELLVDGLTFDLVGLAPGPAAAEPPRARSHGLPENFQPTGLEPVTLQVGPHLAGGATMLPAIRSLAWLAAQLASLPDVEAVAWHPARSWSAPQRFREAVPVWLEGGPFPVGSLAGFVSSPDGGLHSEGLALFCGQDLRLEPELVGGGTTAEGVARPMLEWMVEHAPLGRPEQIVEAEGTRLRLEPSVNGRFVRVWRG